jgi:hypothetical protein
MSWCPKESTWVLVLEENASKATSDHTKRSYHHAEVSAIWRKLASCLRTISSAERIRAAKISALSAAVYKEDMLLTTKVSEGVARASKSEVAARVPKISKISSTIPIR